MFSPKSPLDYHVMPAQAVEPSSMMYSLSYITPHPIREKKRSIHGFSSLVDLVIPPLQILAAVLAGLLMHLTCVHLFSLGIKKLLKKQKGLPTKILAFFFLLFWFFFDQFYNGNLSTENITVDVSELLYSEEQLIRTEMEPCFFDRDGELEMFKGAHKSTLAHKIFLKMNAGDPCFLDTTGPQFSEMLERKNPDKLFWVGIYSASSIMPKIMQLFARKDIYSNLNPIWQSTRAQILSKKIPKAFKAYFNFAIKIYTESGFFWKGFRDFRFSDVLGKLSSLRERNFLPIDLINKTI